MKLISGKIASTYIPFVQLDKMSGHGGKLPYRWEDISQLYWYITFLLWLINWIIHIFGDIEMLAKPLFLAANRRYRFNHPTWRA